MKLKLERNVRSSSSGRAEVRLTVQVVNRRLPKAASPVLSGGLTLIPHASHHGAYPEYTLSGCSLP